MKNRLGPASRPSAIQTRQIWAMPVTMTIKHGGVTDDGRNQSLAHHVPIHLAARQKCCSAAQSGRPENEGRPQIGQIDLIVRPAGKGCERLLGVITGAIEATVDYDLDPSTERIGGSRGKGRNSTANWPSTGRTNRVRNTDPR